MLIPKVSQVPLQQPMYFNGVMSQVWINFFERLATLKNEADLIDLVELAQRVSELPSQAIQSQQGFDLEQIKNKFELSNMYFTQPDQAFDFTPIQISVAQEIPPVQAVFLCQEQLLSQVGLPTNEVIAP
ncbi:hypothetical protein [Acinetobacter junii]|uniref:hypothetical protein n=1 Tax=Acinetobacter junii TaxID=40215 RepID=UPI00124FE1FE|nr:hypothetical protein [Acinetobacter junii]